MGTEDAVNQREWATDWLDAELRSPPKLVGAAGTLFSAGRVCAAGNLARRWHQSQV